MNDPRFPLSIVPQKLQDAYERDLFSYNVARKNLLESWQALQRCVYASAECADGPQDVEKGTET